ncbi:MAG: ABC transporter ATP-binding protein/permease [Bacilli bacterium]|jgi:putative ABC transport system permease protein
MIELRDIKKDYLVGDNVTKALKGVSLHFRKNEFVAILGQSGCGKTTMLNIIGGLDRHTSGDLLINNKSTTRYKGSDWDTYRNRSIGFVFQSYNLINHISVLANVELALTISGVSAKERKRRASEALIRVGLEDKLTKKPHQLSNGQMQRVAIARALINDPEIVLADEPTGALDTETSVQIMDILKEIASDRLVIMVTHNPELAKIYATRIIRLADGLVIGDNNPYDGQKETDETPIERLNKGQKRKASMSFLTALSLSFRNLGTKKSRTILTSFAGSIGIIGIALILSLSSGFSDYIYQVQVDTLSTYPITIEKDTTNYWELIRSVRNNEGEVEYPDDEVVSSNPITSTFVTQLGTSGHVNDLKTFKSHLDQEELRVEYADDFSAIQYAYDIKYQIFSSTYSASENTRLYPFNIPAEINAGRYLDLASIYDELLDNRSLIESQYELLAGDYLDVANEDDQNKVAIILDEYNRLPDYVLFSLNLISLDKLINPSGDVSFSFSDLLDIKLKMPVIAQFYQDEDEDGVFARVEREPANYPLFQEILDDSFELEVGAILRPRPNISATSLNGSIGYLSSLTRSVIDKTNTQPVVVAQLANPTIDILTGAEFVPNASTTFKTRSSELGICDIDTPNAIHIYPTSFEAKDRLIAMIDQYNQDKSENAKIKFTDYVEILMSSITIIINAITTILIAFVSISLVVSSIMIGVITYISVLERTKEIGILRSIGARKRDISRVFNAETLLIGLFSGAMGVGIAAILNWPVNLIINNYVDVGTIAVLPWYAVFILIAISMFLTFLAGLIPSRIASNKDPVIALRTE